MGEFALYQYRQYVRGMLAQRPEVSNIDANSLDATNYSYSFQEPGFTAPPPLHNLGAAEPQRPCALGPKEQQ